MTDWDEVPELRVADLPEGQDPESARESVVIDGKRFFRVPEMGFGMLVAFLAGPGNLACRPGRTGEPVRTTRIEHGRVRRTVRAQDRRDIDLIEDELAGYLRDAGATHPAQVRREVESVLGELYAGS